MEEVRIELLPRLQFVRNFYQAALDYSKTPWVQVADLFGSIKFQSNQLPMLISSRRDDLQVFVFSGKGWKRLDETRLKELDPAVVLSRIKFLTGLK